MTIIISILVLVLLLSVALFVAMTHAFKNPVRKHENIPLERFPSLKEIRFPTKNNKNLYGWWFPTRPSDPLLILVHGWGRNVERMLPYIEKLHVKAHNLLVFDSRNHGNSDADNFSTMVKFAEDIISSIDYAQSQLMIENKDVKVIGLSIGGSAAIYASSLDHRICKVVCVGAFAHPADVMRKQLSDRHIPRPFIWLLLRYIEFKVGFSFNDVAPAHNILKSTARFFVIHGSNDKVVPVIQANKLAEPLTADRVRLWLIPNKGHSDCHFEDDFWTQIQEFLTATDHE